MANTSTLNQTVFHQENQRKNNTKKEAATPVNEIIMEVAASFFSKYNNAECLS